MTHRKKKTGPGVARSPARNLDAGRERERERERELEKREWQTEGERSLAGLRMEALRANIRD